MAAGRRGWIGALALLGLLWLAGCQRHDDGVVLRFWAMGREAEVVSELVRQFEQQHPGVRVQVQAIPWTAAHEKLLTAYAGDGLPDLCQLGNTWIPEFATLGALEPLQPWVDRSAVIDADDYFPGIWDTNIIDGQLVGIPWYVDTRLLYYRKDLLARAGFDQPPRDWAQWRQMLAAIKRSGVAEYGVLMPLNEFEQQLSLALQQPEPLLREHDTRGNFRSAGFARALGLYAEMFAQGWAPAVSETQISNVWDEFFNGYNVFYLSGPWNIREFKARQPAALAGQWATAALPGPDGPGAGIAGGTSLVVFRSSAHKQAAWQLVEFLSQPQVQQRFYALVGDLPPRRSAWRDGALAADPLAQPFAEQLERVKPTPKVLEWERIAQELRIVTEQVVRGGLDPARAGEQLDARVDAILAKRRWIHEQEGRQ